MRELLEFIAKSMVTNPDAVEITVVEKEAETVFKLLMNVASLNLNFSFKCGFNSKSYCAI